MGKRPAQAVGEAEFCSEIFGYYADNGPALLADKALPGHDSARIEYLPVGPVLGVMPWNYPYYQVARFAAPNLIAGNTVMLKHAENCPTSALAIAQIMRMPACRRASTEPVRHPRAGRRDDRRPGCRRR